MTTQLVRPVWTPEDFAATVAAAARAVPITLVAVETIEDPQ